MRNFLFFLLCLFIPCVLQAQSDQLLAEVGDAIEWRGSAKDSVEIVDIVLEGHKITKEHIVLRELALKKGDRIHKNDLSEVLEKETNKIFNTDLFIKSSIEPQEVAPGKIALVIHLREQWYVYPIPIFELGDRNFNEWLKQRDADFSRLEYGLRLKVKNFRGRNEHLRLLFQFGFTKKLELDYRLPYINRKKTIGLQFRFFYAQNNSTAYQTLDNQLIFLDDQRSLLRRFNSKIGVSIRSKFYNRHYISAHYNNNQIADTVAQLNTNYFGDNRLEQRYLGLQYTFVRDLRNKAAYPTKGYYLRASLEKKGLGVFDDLNTLTLRTHFAKFTELAPRWFLSNSILTKFSLPENQPFSELRAVGYRPYVARGYELYVINGEHLMLSKNTLRFCLFEGEQKLDKLKFIPRQFSVIPVAGYFKVYSDIARVEHEGVRRETSRFNNQWLWSVGVGFDFVTYYNMVARFEYSMNSELERGFFFNLKSDF